jgi:hypothetical protein
MQIPKRIQVGNTEYATIMVNKAKRQDTLGTIDYTHGIIWLAKRDAYGNKLDKAELADSFWHEMTHAVLHDMKHELCSDEKFVNAFANRLSSAINSAQL